MTPRLNKSLLMLFDSDPVAEKLDLVRHRVKEEFGGGSALSLPIHLTLLKWRSSRLPPQLAGLLLHDFPRITVSLGNLVFSAEHRAIWFDAESEQLPALLQQSNLALDACSVTTLREPQHPHITIAYRDYSVAKLSRIRKSLDGIEISPADILRCSRLVLGAADMHGVWHLHESTAK
jgi:hypothetical protein